EVMGPAREGHGDPCRAEVGEAHRLPPALEVDDRHDPVARVDGPEDQVDHRDGRPHTSLRSRTPIWRMNSLMELRSPTPRSSRAPLSVSTREVAPARCRLTVKVVPASGALSTSMRPPIAST